MHVVLQPFSSNFFSNWMPAILLDVSSGFFPSFWNAIRCSHLDFKWLLFYCDFFHSLIQFQKFCLLYISSDISLWLPNTQSTCLYYQDFLNLDCILGYISLLENNCMKCIHIATVCSSDANILIQGLWSTKHAWQAKSGCVPACTRRGIWTNTKTLCWGKKSLAKWMDGFQLEENSLKVLHPY